ncbi:uncharacterized membrane-anchored protein YitT (DUF2179 family) [Bacillus pakistanensis]|uniref:Uncharacterized membrane-anchored protein YitT (DUF2179 family) n=1 Tax=Rossellomorea pakistanensis TaxID=992288 RepID=A0ABS2NDH0_9BACI|nr:DUF2179 domain-containing protein [Bacillus pakistanensis]MBM7585917.1 uncharacterized membrane-anchored protein YitT (DUF2179 family) [Bacillus pakistanensis]
MNQGGTKINTSAGRDNPILIIVVDHTEFTKLKQVVRGIDPFVFLAAMGTTPEFEEGFKRV